MIFYESPFRVPRLLGELAAVLGGGREVSVSRELTKKFEQTVRGTLDEVTAHFKTHEPKGEFVVVVAGKSRKQQPLITEGGPSVPRRGAEGKDD